jgi:hypothetical protein
MDRPTFWSSMLDVNSVMLVMGNIVQGAIWALLFRELG